jgi:hypothetical protein
LTFRFETFGYAGLKPLDIVTLDGQKARIVNISMRFTAPNDFWMNVEAEWFFSQGKGQNNNLGGDGTGSPNSP